MGRGLVFANAFLQIDCSHSGNRRIGQRNEQLDGLGHFRITHQLHCMGNTCTEYL